MTAFQIEHAWLDRRDDHPSELDATFSRFRFVVNDKNVAEYVETDGTRQADLHIPSYYVAEWLAENWWSILFEPRKTEEESDSASFLTRHSLATAQHGFALPALLFVPVGRAMGISAGPRHVPFTDVTFTRGASAYISITDAESILKRFVAKSVERLKSRHIGDSLLEHLWDKISHADADERQFCELIGALGVSPYTVEDRVATAVEKLFDKLGYRGTRDFCMAASEESIEDSVAYAIKFANDLSAKKEISLRPLRDIALPPENLNHPSWRRGVAAAKLVMKKFNVSVTDASGADKFFDRLGIDVRALRNATGSNEPVEPFAGAIDRNDDEAKIDLLQDMEDKRRFSAARAAYLGWASEPRSFRFVTSTLSRDQQASRAFAAEIIVPFEYINKQASSGKLRQDQVYEIATSRRAALDVVRKQALNNGIAVVSM